MIHGLKYAPVEKNAILYILYLLNTLSSIDN